MEIIVQLVTVIVQVVGDVATIIQYVQLVDIVQMPIVLDIVHTKYAIVAEETFLHVHALQVVVAHVESV